MERGSGMQVPLGRIVRRAIRSGLRLTLFMALAAPSSVEAAPGDLDLSFGTGGLVSTNFGTNLSGVKSDDSPAALTIQPDGKIVVAGSTRFFPSNISDIALARYDADGSLDPSFGDGGKVITDLGSPRGESASALVLQSDGKILVAGNITTDVGVNFLVARYNADGSLDAGFGRGGRITTVFSGFDRVHALGLQPDGKILVAGEALFRGTDIALARYNADGSLDAGFGSGGRVVTDIAGGADAATGLAVQPDGRIVVLGGWARDPGGGCCQLGPDFFALVRYHPNGALDGSFGSGGKVTTGFPFGGFGFVSFAPPGAITIQPDGRIVLLRGSTLTRFNPDGTLDPTFPIESGGLGLPGLQPDGKIVLSGAGKCLSSTILAFCPTDINLTRYNSNGTPDPTFGNNGTATTDVPGNMFWPSALALQLDGKIILAGINTPFGGSTDFGLARFEGGSLDNTPVLGLHLSRRTINPGDALRVDVTAANPGPAFDADLFFGALLPDGRTLVFLTALAPPALAGGDLGGDARTFRPLLTNVHMPGGFIGELVADFSYTFGGPEPTGEYRFFAALVKRGAFQDGRMDPGDIVALATKTFGISGLTVPTPITPIDNTALKPNDQSGRCWTFFFDWTDAHSSFGIFGYFLTVQYKDLHVTTESFLFRFITASELSVVRCAVFDAPALALEWSVQAIDNLGNFTPWSDGVAIRLEH